MEKEQRKQSVADELLDMLIYQAQNNSLPSNLTNIKFNFQMRSLAYDQNSALLHTRMQLVLYWSDPRLQWKPESYGQMTSFEHPRLQIWLPQIIALK